MGILMIKYLVTQIEQLNLKYADVVKKYPKDKEAIDKLLKEDGMEHLIKE